MRTPSAGSSLPARSAPISMSQAPSPSDCFPALPAARFVQVGNAAGMGVRQMLASGAARAQAAGIAARCRYVELSTVPGFQQVFMQHIGFDTSARATS